MAFRSGGRAGGRANRNFAKARRAKALMIERIRKRGGKVVPPLKRPKLWTPRFGGYPSMKQIRSSYVGKQALNAIYNKMTKVDIPGAMQYVKGMNTALAVAGRRGGKTYTATSSENLNGPGKNNNVEIPIISETTTTKVSQSGLDKGDRKVFKTSIFSGVNTSSAITAMGKLQGETTYFGCDTKQGRNDDNYVPNSITRTESHGFNQKSWYVFPQGATFTVRQIIQKFFGVRYAAGNPINIVRQATDAKDKAYLGVKNIKTQFSFMNKNRYLPVNMRLHYIAVKDALLEGANVPAKFVKETFNDIGTIQDFGAVPNRYQFSDIITKQVFDPSDIDKADLEQSFQVITSNKCTLKSSPNFREGFQVAATFGRRLQPNDTWKVEHTHTLGSGLELYAALAQIKISDDVLAECRDTVVAGFWVLETWGTPVQAEIAQQVGPTITTTVQGTAPGQIHYEYKTNMKAVNSTGNSFRVDQESIEPQLLVRTFKREDYAPDQPGLIEQNVAYQKIVPGLASIGSVGDTYIPLLTDLEPVGAGSRAS